MNTMTKRFTFALLALALLSTTGSAWALWPCGSPMCEILGPDAQCLLPDGRGSTCGGPYLAPISVDPLGSEGDSLESFLETLAELPVEAPSAGRVQP